MANNYMRAHPDFSRIVRRLAREGTRVERRRVSIREVTGLLTSIAPGDWDTLVRQAFTAQQGAMPAAFSTPTEDPQS